MAKPSVRAEVNNFVQGLITEASPLNFPPNASLDEENFELNRNGTRDRRLGMGYEPGFILRPAPIPGIEVPDAKFNTYKWENVGGVSTNELLVVQSERFLTFFDLNEDSLSGATPVGNIELTSFPIATRYSFTSAEGTLVVAAGVGTVALVTYDGTAFSVEYIVLKVRDVWGVEETTIPQYETDVAYRGAYSDQHYYNLQNQSWGIPRPDAASGTVYDPSYDFYHSLPGFNYPSNSEVVWTALQFQPVSAGTSTERIYQNLWNDARGSTIVAPKGYYVIDLLKRGSSRMAEYVNNKAKYPQIAVASVMLPQDSTSGGAKVVSEFAGRVWYSGFSGEVTDGDKRSPILSNFIAFSQLVKSKTDFAKCYQYGDPTSRENNDVVDTDGGFLRVSGAKEIISMINLESHMIVIASNGVWTITGGNDYGFSATNYKVTKISSFGGLSDSTVVIEGGRAFFWSEDGIYVIAKDQFGNFGVSNITQTTIQTLYENIDTVVKLEATGEYDPINKKIRWLYKSGTKFGDDSVTKELILDTVLNVFYQNKINKLSNNSVEVMGLFASTPFKRGEVFNPVYVESDQVFSAAEAVGITETIRSSGIQSMRYFVVYMENGIAYFTFSYYNNAEFLDWEETDGVGVDAKAYLLSGQQTTGDSAISKQIPYLIMYFTRTEEGVTSGFVPDKQSGCLMRCQWDFSNTINSKKWTPLVQVYRYRRAQYITGLDDDYDNGFELVVSKSKVRGRGKAFSLYLETEPRKDCRITGWSISLNGNTVT